TSDHLLAQLTSLLGDAVITTGPELDQLSRDSSRYHPTAPPLAVVMARTTAEVSAALGWAHRHQITVSVRGAGTGLSGGAVGYAGGFELLLPQINQIRDIDAVDRLAVVGAGVITAELDRAVRQHGLFFPPDPASVEISTVGGNIATNAGGLRCISHGVTRDGVARAEERRVGNRCRHVAAMGECRELV